MDLMSVKTSPLSRDRQNSHGIEMPPQSHQVRAVCTSLDLPVLFLVTLGKDGSITYYTRVESERLMSLMYVMCHMRFCAAEAEQLDKV